MPCDAGRSLSLLDPTYASKYIPIIASVSEHQPPSWPSYFTDLQARPALPADFFLVYHEHQPPSWPSYFTDLQARPALPAGFCPCLL